MSAVFDSNILIYYLSGTLNPSGKLRVARASEDGACVSIITRIEVLGWPEQDEEASRRAKNLLEQFNEQPLTDEIADQCITLRQQRSIRIPDAIIAATALHLSFPLITRNTDDFNGIEGLELINPFAADSPPEQ